MRRRQLIELEDTWWCPAAVRDGGTDWVAFMANATGIFSLVAPKIRSAMQRTNTNAVLDLCSGGGGPWPTLIDELLKGGPARVELSDLYPNLSAFKRIQETSTECISFRSESVDAANVSETLTGVRTIFNAFHHFPPAAAQSILADAIQKPYFERFRQERAIDVPLAFDADRAFYSKLGLIVFPTTIVVDKEGKLAHVISLRNPEYSHLLDSYVRHALGSLTDEQLRESLKAHPASDGSPKSLASSHRAVARYHREKGRLDAARDELNKAREQDPANPDILLDLADLDLLAGSLDEAGTLVESVLATHPEHRRAKQVKGIILFRRDRIDEAESVLREALVLNPDPGRIHYYLGQIYERQGQTAKALEQYRLALQTFLNEPEAPK